MKLVSIKCRFSWQEITSYRNPSEIVYNTSESECTISLVNNNVISQPGYLCYLIDVDDIYFYKRFFIIYIEYTRKGNVYTCPIAYEY